MTIDQPYFQDRKMTAFSIDTNDKDFREIRVKPDPEHLRLLSTENRRHRMRKGSEEPNFKMTFENDEYKGHAWDRNFQNSLRPLTACSVMMKGHNNSDLKKK